MEWDTTVRNANTELVIELHASAGRGDYADFSKIRESIDRFDATERGTGPSRWPGKRESNSRRLFASVSVDCLVECILAIQDASFAATAYTSIQM